jgi:hypothetical protein
MNRELGILLCMVVGMIMIFPVANSSYISFLRTLGIDTPNIDSSPGTSGHFEVQWEKSYGDKWWWSARYEGPQPIGDADNDGQNELLIGGRDPFMRVMKWDSTQQTYYEQQKIIDPVFGIGYGLTLHFLNNFYRIPVPFGSATGFSIADIDNDGQNEIGVAWGRHFSAFE